MIEATQIFKGRPGETEGSQGGAAAGQSARESHVCANRGHEHFGSCAHT